MKKMRTKEHRSYEAANEYLEKEYLPEHNRRFARPRARWWSVSGKTGGWSFGIGGAS